MMNYRVVLSVLAAIVSVNFFGCANAVAKEKDTTQMWVFDLTRQEVHERTMKPYTGPSVKGVDTSTLDGKMVCGYQGWFTCPGDGSGKAWYHWAYSEIGKFGAFKPGNCSIDLWPDMSEYPDELKYPTQFKHKDGSTAYVFSSMDTETVNLHFKWMAEYGISGAFVQRFAKETFRAIDPYHCTTVLANCREAANRNGRGYAVMYDLSNLLKNDMEKVKDDWRNLIDRMKLTRDENDKAYMHHNGKPIVGVWGVGYNRAYDPDVKDFLEFLKNDPKYGGNTILLGLNNDWKEAHSAGIPVMQLVKDYGDIVSPWEVGRYYDDYGVEKKKENYWVPDMQWCKENGKDYLPVNWPGFKWYNHTHGRDKHETPRRGGQFLWKQYAEAKKAGATMIYTAMFDELDEGTCIIKFTNDPPLGGGSKFIVEEGVENDRYLWLAGQGQKMLRGEIPITDKMPVREKK